MSTWLLVLLCVLVVAGWALWSRARRNSRGATDSMRVRHPYHCVAIKPRSDACEAVRRLEGKRFLADEAPHIPLVGCTVAACRCMYMHYEDRRDEERRSPYHANAGVWNGTGLVDRRVKLDRRQSGELQSA